MHTIKFSHSDVEDDRKSKTYCRRMIYDVASDMKDGEGRLRATDIDAVPIKAYEGTKIKVFLDYFRDWPGTDGLRHAKVIFRVFADKPSKIVTEHGALSVFGTWSHAGDEAAMSFDKYSPEGRIEAALEKHAEQDRIEKAAMNRARIANFIAQTLTNRSDKAARALGFDDALKALIAHFEKKRLKVFEAEVEELRKDPTIVGPDGSKTVIEQRVLEVGIGAAEKLWPSALPCGFGERRESEPVKWEDML